MEKSTVYFTDFRCPVGTSQLDKLKNSVSLLASKTLIWKVNLLQSKCILANWETWRFFVRIMRKWLQISVKSRRSSVPDRLQYVISGSRKNAWSTLTAQI